MFLIGIDRLSAIIPNGAALSAPIGFGSKTLCALLLPSTWNAAALTFQVSPDGTNFYELVNAAGAAATVLAAANQFAALDPSLWHGVNLLIIRSGTLGAPLRMQLGRRWIGHRGKRQAAWVVPGLPGLRGKKLPVRRPGTRMPRCTTSRGGASRASRALRNGGGILEDQIKSLTVQIVSAHIANNDVSVDQLPGLIRDVHQALATVGQASAEAIKPAPAVAAKKSVFADHIICLDCGKSFRMLKRHLSTDHQMTPDQYRAKWDLPPSYPMVAAEYAATRSKLAKESGLGRKADAPPPPKKHGR